MPPQGGGMEQIMAISILKEREASIVEVTASSTTKNAIAAKAARRLGCDGSQIGCNKASVSGAVSQKACVFCGARVVLNPITDALHIIHGPIGCSSYTWDIRGSLSSGSELYRQSFSTDMREIDIVFGGERKLAAAIDEAVQNYQPKLIFVYATCIVGVIGDDVEAVCMAAEKRHSQANDGAGIRVIPVMAPGFSGHKAQGYQLAGDAIMRYICGTAPATTPAATTPASSAPAAPTQAAAIPTAPATTQATTTPPTHGINILGDFNLAGETWIIRNYLQQLGIEVIGSVTGDSNSNSLLKAREARLNVVQCAGSSINLAEKMQAQLGIPYIRVSFYGVEDTCSSIIQTAESYARLMPDKLAAAKLIQAAKNFCAREAKQTTAQLQPYKERLTGKKAAIYVGGGFKAISLIKQFNELGISTVMVGTQTGSASDYDTIRALVNPGCVVLDDANPAELQKFLVDKGADLLVGGVKERPLAYKLGVAFCDHNHERKLPLAGFVGALNFAQEVNLSIASPVWSYLC
jgi:nitrogenase molybdenum-cofactor synthesis protein NifE